MEPSQLVTLSEPVVELQNFRPIECSNCREQLFPVSGGALPSDPFLNPAIFELMQGLEMVKVSRILETVFKFNYFLDAKFPEEVLWEDIPLCPSCANILNHVSSYQREFLRVQRLGSLLSDKIEKLDFLIRASFKTVADADAAAESQQQYSECDFNDNLENINVDDDTGPLLSATSQIDLEGILERLESPFHEPRVVLTPLNEREILSKIDKLDKIPVLDNDILKSAGIDEDAFDHVDVVSMPDLTTEDEDTCSPLHPTTTDDESEKLIIIQLELEQFGRNACVANEEEEEEEEEEVEGNKNDQSSPISLDEEEPIQQEAKKRGRRGPKVGKEGKKKKPGFHETFHRRKLQHPYPCVYCQLDFDTESERVEHLKASHCKQKSVICSKCGKVFANNNVKSKHLPKCGKVPEKYRLPPFLCKFCGREFETYRIQTIHEKHVHATSRPFACDECNFTGKTAACLVIHKKQVHTPAAKVKCQECNQILKSQTALEYHIKRMHTPDGKEKYQEQHRRVEERRKGIREQKQSSLTTICTECNIDFQTVHRMVKHRLKEHASTDETRFQCEECGKGFVKSRSFWKHRKTVHSNDRPYACEQCGSSFKVLNSLTNHLNRVHSQEGREKYNEYNRVNYRRKRKIEEVLTSNVDEVSSETDKP